MSRDRLLGFLAVQPQCVVAMEACATAHYWGREISRLGHEVRLIPTIYVKPFVKRQKNDNTEAIAEAAGRPSKHFAAVKTEAQQARAMLFRTRNLLVRQRMQLINALRGHLAEHGAVTAQGKAHLKRLEATLVDENSAVPTSVHNLGQIFVELIVELDGRIADLNRKLRVAAKDAETTRRLQTMPGLGPITAVAIEAFAPSMDTFHRGRDFAAWLGLVPRQYSTGGKQRLGRTSEMGQRDIRRLLIIGAMAVIRHAARSASPSGSLLSRMLTRRLRMLVAISLANKMARVVSATLTKQENYRDPAAAAS